MGFERAETSRGPVVGLGFLSRARRGRKTWPALTDGKRTGHEDRDTGNSVVVFAGVPLHLSVIREIGPRLCYNMQYRPTPRNGHRVCMVTSLCCYTFGSDGNVVHKVLLDV